MYDNHLLKLAGMPDSTRWGTLDSMRSRTGLTSSGNVDPLAFGTNMRGAARLRSQYYTDDDRKHFQGQNPWTPTLVSRPAFASEHTYNTRDHEIMSPEYLQGLQEKIKGLKGLTGGFSSDRASAQHAFNILPDSFGDHKPEINVSEVEFGKHMHKPVYTHELSHFMSGNRERSKYLDPSYMSGLHKLVDETKATTAETAIALAMGWDPSQVLNQSTGGFVAPYQMQHMDRLKSLAFPEGMPDVEKLRTDPDYYHAQQMQMLKSLHNPESDFGKAFNGYISEMMPHADLQATTSFSGTPATQVRAKNRGVMGGANKMWEAGSESPANMSKKMQYEMQKLSPVSSIPGSWTALGDYFADQGVSEVPQPNPFLPKKEQLPTLDMGELAFGMDIWDESTNPFGKPLNTISRPPVHTGNTPVVTSGQKPLYQDPFQVANKPLNQDPFKTLAIKDEPNLFGNATKTPQPVGNIDSLMDQ